MKIKVFKFRVSNAASSICSGDETENWFKRRQAELKSPEDIEATVNAFLMNRKIIDIKVNTVDVHYHNNARGNTVDLVYTIMYE